MNNNMSNQNQFKRSLPASNNMIPMKIQRIVGTTTPQCVKMDLSKFPADVWPDIVELLQDKDLHKCCYELMFHQTLSNLLEQHGEFLANTNSRATAEGLRKIAHDYLITLGSKFINKYADLSTPAQETFIEGFYQNCDQIFKSHKISHYAPDRKKRGLEYLISQMLKTFVSTPNTNAGTTIAGAVPQNQANRNAVTNGYTNQNMANINLNQRPYQNMAPQTPNVTNVAQYMRSNSLQSTQSYALIQQQQQQQQQMHSAIPNNIFEQQSASVEPMYGPLRPKPPPSYSNYSQQTISTFNGNGLMATQHVMSVPSNTQTAYVQNSNQTCTNMNMSQFNNNNNSNLIDANQFQYGVIGSNPNQNAVQNGLEPSLEPYLTIFDEDFAQINPFPEIGNTMPGRIVDRRRTYAASHQYSPVTTHPVPTALAEPTASFTLHDLLNNTPFNAPTTTGVQMNSITAIQSSSITLTMEQPQTMEPMLSNQTDSVAPPNVNITNNATLTNPDNPIRIVVYPDGTMAYKEVVTPATITEAPATTTATVAQAQQTSLSDASIIPGTSVESDSEVKTEYDRLINDTLWNSPPSLRNNLPPSSRSPSPPILSMPSMPVIDERVGEIDSGLRTPVPQQDAMVPVEEPVAGSHNENQNDILIDFQTTEEVYSCEMLALIEAQKNRVMSSGSPMDIANGENESATSLNDVSNISTPDVIQQTPIKSVVAINDKEINKTQSESQAQSVIKVCAFASANMTASASNNDEMDVSLNNIQSSSSPQKSSPAKDINVNISNNIVNVNTTKNGTTDLNASSNQLKNRINSKINSITSTTINQPKVSSDNAASVIKDVSGNAASSAKKTIPEVITVKTEKVVVSNCNSSTKNSNETQPKPTNTKNLPSTSQTESVGGLEGTSTSTASTSSQSSNKANNNGAAMVTGQIKTEKVATASSSLDPNSGATSSRNDSAKSITARTVIQSPSKSNEKTSMSPSKTPPPPILPSKSNESSTPPCSISALVASLDGKNIRDMVTSPQSMQTNLKRPRTATSSHAPPSKIVCTEATAPTVSPTKKLNTISGRQVTPSDKTVRTETSTPNCTPNKNPSTSSGTASIQMSSSSSKIIKVKAAVPIPSGSPINKASTKVSPQNNTSTASTSNNSQASKPSTKNDGAETPVQKVSPSKNKSFSSATSGSQASTSSTKNVRAETTAQKVSPSKNASTSSGTSSSQMSPSSKTNVSPSKSPAITSAKTSSQKLSACSVPKDAVTNNPRPTSASVRSQGPSSSKIPRTESSVPKISPINNVNPTSATARGQATPSTKIIHREASATKMSPPNMTNSTSVTANSPVPSSSSKNIRAEASAATITPTSKTSTTPAPSSNPVRSPSTKAIGAQASAATISPTNKASTTHAPSPSPSTKTIGAQASAATISPTNKAGTTPAPSSNPVRSPSTKAIGAQSSAATISSTNKASTTPAPTSSPREPNNLKSFGTPKSKSGKTPSPSSRMEKLRASFSKAIPPHLIRSKSQSVLSDASKETKPFIQKALPMSRKSDAKVTQFIDLLSDDEEDELPNVPDKDDEDCCIVEKQIETIDICDDDDDNDTPPPPASASTKILNKNEVQAISSDAAESVTETKPAGLTGKFFCLECLKNAVFICKACMCVSFCSLECEKKSSLHTHCDTPNIIEIANYKNDT